MPEPRPSTASGLSGADGQLLAERFGDGDGFVAFTELGGGLAGRGFMIGLV